MERVLSLKLRIDWSDLDTYEHVNNISIMRFLQSARVQFWEQAGWVQYYRENKIGHILVSTRCDFKKALYYPGEVMVKTRVEFIKNSSFGLYHQLFDYEDNLCSESHDIAVCYDFKNEVTLRIPEVLRAKMKML